MRFIIVLMAAMSLTFMVSWNNIKTTINDITNVEVEYDKYSNIVSISESRLETMIDLEDSFILVITQTGCSHCEAYLPVLNSVLKENHVIAYEINVAELTADERDDLKDIVNYSGTPTTVFFEDGEEDTLNRIVGNVAKEKIEDKLEIMGYND